MKFLLLFVLCLALAACAPASPAAPVIPPSTSLLPGPRVTQAVANSPSAALTGAPSLAPTMTRPVPTSSPGSQTPLATGDLVSQNLAAFVKAWDSGDLQAIRALYTPDARIYSEAAMAALQERQPVEAQVSGESFADLVKQYAGAQLTLPGEPLVVFDKLVAIPYRWEREGAVINGAALLRYEGDKILLHTFLEDAQSSAATQGSSPDLRETLEGLMEAWNAGDLQAARRFYSSQAVILSDEDLALAPWRDSPQPAGLEQLLKQFTGWEPTIVGEPIRFGPFVLSYWRWSRLVAPTGTGIRLLRLQDGAIQTDVRFAIRPWEARGSAFLDQ